MIFAKLLVYLEPINSWHSSSLETHNLTLLEISLRLLSISTYYWCACDTSPIYYYSLLNHFLRRLENVFHLWWHSLYWLSLGESEVLRRDWKESFFCVYRGWRWKSLRWRRIGHGIQWTCRRGGMDCVPGAVHVQWEGIIAAPAGEPHLPQTCAAWRGCMAVWAVCPGQAKERPGLLPQKLGETSLCRRWLLGWPKCRLVSTVCQRKRSEATKAIGCKGTWYPLSLHDKARTLD